MGARRGREGAGEIVLNSIDADGTRNGYELTVTGLISRGVGIPVVASGGAGKVEHLVSVFRDAGADAALVASIVHDGSMSVAGIKSALKGQGIRDSRIVIRDGGRLGLLPECSILDIFA